MGAPCARDAMKCVVMSLPEPTEKTPKHKLEERLAAYRAASMGSPLSGKPCFFVAAGRINRVRLRNGLIATARIPREMGLEVAEGLNYKGHDVQRPAEALR